MCVCANFMSSLATYTLNELYSSLSHMKYNIKNDYYYYAQLSSLP